MKAKYIATIVGAALLIAGCGGCGGSVTSQGIANIRAISATSTPSSIDVFSDFNLIAFGLESNEGSTYSLQQAQNLSIGVRQTGNTTTLGSFNYEPAAGQYYTTIVYETASNVLGFMVLEDNGATPAATKFKLRLAHVNRLKGAVDVYFTNVDTDLADETPVLQDVTYQTATNYIELTGGIAKQIRVTNANSTTQVGSSINMTPAILSKQTLVLRDDSGPEVKIYTDN